MGERFAGSVYEFGVERKGIVLAFRDVPDLPASVAEWEAAVLEDYPDTVLREALKRDFGIRSAAYFLRRAEKVEFIRDELSRPRFLELAAQRRKDYRKPTESFRDRVVRNLGQSPPVWKYVGRKRMEEPVLDPWSERRIKNVVVLAHEDEQVFVQPRTCQVLREYGLLEGWLDTDPVPHRKKRSRKPEGTVSVMDVVEGSGVSETVTSCEGMVPPTADGELPPVDDLLDDVVIAEPTVEPVEEEPTEEPKPAPETPDFGSVDMEALLAEIFSD